jgi:hypothetical protein
MTYQVRFMRKFKTWSVLVIEHPTNYIVDAYGTKNLLEAVKYWLASKNYWK